MNGNRQSIRRALSIGTADSSGLGGVSGDARVFAALGVYPMSVVTAVAARNTRELAAVAEVPEEVVIAQIDAVLEDIGADAIKIGALWSSAIAGNIADRLEAWGNDRVVVAPMLATMSEAGRLTAEYLSTLRNDLFPHAFLLVLDWQELSLASGEAIATAEEALLACQRLQADAGCRILLSGAESDMSRDVFISGEDVEEFPAATPPDIHRDDVATVLSGALTGLLATGLDARAAVRRAMQIRDDTLTRALPIGDGVLAPLHTTALHD